MRLIQQILPQSARRSAYAPAREGLVKSVGSIGEMNAKQTMQKADGSIPLNKTDMSDVLHSICRPIHSRRAAGKDQADLKVGSRPKRAMNTVRERARMQRMMVRGAAMARSSSKTLAIVRVRGYADRMYNKEDTGA